MPDSLASLTHSRANLLMELAEVDNQIADIARDADALKAENALLRAQVEKLSPDSDDAPALSDLDF